jgi:hypothetical protein
VENDISRLAQSMSAYAPILLAFVLYLAAGIGIVKLVKIWRRR